MQLDHENTIYVCLDGENGDVKLLVPRNFKLEIMELKLDDPDPDSTDAAEYHLLKTEMDEHRFDL